jgi:hypothetical protein
MLTFPPDISFVVQIVSFLVLWFGLKRLLFDPALHVLEERERRTVGARDAADGLRKAAEGSAADNEQRMKAIRVKFAADGSASERTMRMSTPYAGTTDYGILTMTQAEIYEAVDDAHSHNFQVGIHANGDVTIDMVLKAYERAGSRASVNRLAALLAQLEYIYPYHQAVGFYLERSGVFTPSAIELFRGKFKYEFDFYLTYEMKQTQYHPRWRLHVPKGY